MKTRKLRDITVSEIGIGCMGFSHGYGQIAWEEYSIEATRNAWGRNNFITVEVHGSKGSIYFNYERLNELQVCFADDPDDRRGFKTIYTGPAHFHGEVTWNIPGMNIGYGELKSIETYEFIKAVVEGKRPSTSFAEGYRVERVCDAVKRSAETGRWEKVAD